MLVALRTRLGWLSEKEKSSVASVEQAVLGKRFCISCKHFVHDNKYTNPKHGRCGHPAGIKTRGKNSSDEISDYLVAGIPLPPVADELHYCATMRNKSFECGPDGNLWEPKA